MSSATDIRTTQHIKTRTHLKCSPDTPYYSLITAFMVDFIAKDMAQFPNTSS